MSATSSVEAQRWNRFISERDIISQNNSEFFKRIENLAAILQEILLQQDRSTTELFKPENSISTVYVLKAQIQQNHASLSGCGNVLSQLFNENCFVQPIDMIPLAVEKLLFQEQRFRFADKKNRALEIVFMSSDNALETENAEEDTLEDDLTHKDVFNNLDDFVLVIKEEALPQELQYPHRGGWRVLKWAKEWMWGVDATIDPACKDLAKIGSELRSRKAIIQELLKAIYRGNSVTYDFASCQREIEDLKNKIEAIGQQLEPKQATRGVPEVLFYASRWIDYADEVIELLNFAYDLSGPFYAETLRKKMHLFSYLQQTSAPTRTVSQAIEKLAHLFKFIKPLAEIPKQANKKVKSNFSAPFRLRVETLLNQIIGEVGKQLLTVTSNYQVPSQEKVLSTILRQERLDNLRLPIEATNKLPECVELVLMQEMLKALYFSNVSIQPRFLLPFCNLHLLSSYHQQLEESLKLTKSLKKIYDIYLQISKPHLPDEEVQKKYGQLFANLSICQNLPQHYRNIFRYAQSCYAFQMSEVSDNAIETAWHDWAKEILFQVQVQEHFPAWVDAEQKTLSSDSLFTMLTCALYGSEEDENNLRQMIDSSSELSLSKEAPLLLLFMRFILNLNEKTKSRLSEGERKLLVRFFEIYSKNEIEQFILHFVYPLLGWEVMIFKCIQRKETSGVNLYALQEKRWGEQFKQWKTCLDLYTKIVERKLDQAEVLKLLDPLVLIATEVSSVGKIARTCVSAIVKLLPDLADKLLPVWKDPNGEGLIQSLYKPPFLNPQQSMTIQSILEFFGTLE